MPRGQASPLGAETVNALGYRQVKVANGKWVGKHILILEEKLGRKLRPGERAVFKDNDKTNLDPKNIGLAEGRTKESIKARIARLQSEIEDRQALIKLLEDELEQTSRTD